MPQILLQSVEAAQSQHEHHKRRTQRHIGRYDGVATLVSEFGHERLEGIDLLNVTKEASQHGNYSSRSNSLQ